MAETRDELLEHYRKMRGELLAAIAGMRDEALVEPTLDGWSVKDHLAHIALWDDLRASEIERISAGHESAWRMNGEQDAALNELSHALRQHLSLQQVRWELEHSGRSVLEAIGAASERGLDGSLYGEAGLRSGHEAAHTRWIERWRREQGL